jgi:SAM-dependent methyltransferase
MSIYAEPRYVDDPATCVFYHVLDLPGIGTVKGYWDLRDRFDDYTGGVPLAGTRFLDVGSASGFLSFEAERRGAAEVVSFDSADPKMHAAVPYREIRTSTHPHPVIPNFHEVRNGYWLTHRLLGSRVKCFYGDVYDLPAELGEFDVVMVGQILGHLRDPLGALTSIAPRCRGKLIITDFMYISDQPLAWFPGSVDLPETMYRPMIWWQLSPVLIRNFLRIVGLEVIAFTTKNYEFGEPNSPTKGVTSLSTIIAQRTEPLA